MRPVWQKLHEWGDVLHLPDLPKWMCGLLFLILILRIPSFFEPYNYGDEMIYLSLGQGVRQGVELYKDIHDNKPPLLYWTAALAENLFWFKVILAFWNLITIVIFYKLALILFPKRQKTQKIATFAFAILSTIPLLEGNIVNSELFMIGFSILAFLILLKKNAPNYKTLFFAGVLFGIATLFKIPAMFDLPVIIVYWAITDIKNWKSIVKNSLVLLSGFTAPIVLTFILYFYQGALTEYVQAAFLQNVGYLSSFRPGDVREPFLVRNLPLIIRGIVVTVGVAILYFVRKKVSGRFIFFATWVLFALFAVTLSERPYPHYLIQVIPPIAFLIAILIRERTLEQVFVIFPLTLTLLVPVYYKFYIYPTTDYYVRFINFATKKIDRNTYFSGFSKTVNRNYNIAEFLTQSSSTADRVFMWDPDSSTVYALSRRLPPIKYVADYHVKDFSSKEAVALQIESELPKFIILSDKHPFTELYPLIGTTYLAIHRIEDVVIYSRVNLIK
jgi:hypothetical protein